MTSATPGLLIADRSAAPSFHAVDGHRLLRFVDPSAVGGAAPPPIVAGDIPPPPPLPGVLTPGSVKLRLTPGVSRTVNYRLALPANPTPLNVFFLVDVSSTLADYQDQLNSSIRAITTALARKGVSFRAGLGTIGTGPSKGRPDYPVASAGVLDVSNPQAPPRPYRKPTLYHLLRRLGPVDAGFYQALGNVQTETLPKPNFSANSTDPRSSDPVDPEEGQLLAMEQSVNTRGVLSPTSTPALPSYSVPGGQEAGFRADPFQRNVLLTATDEFFANPAGSPDKPDGSLDFDRVIRQLKAFRVESVGITMGQTDESSSYSDLSRVAIGTGAVAPPGGLACSGSERIPAGRPLVCTDQSNFGSLLSNVLSSLRDVQDLTVGFRGDTSVVRAMSIAALARRDVTKATSIPLSVTFSCQGSTPGLHTSALQIRLRGYVVGTSNTLVDCAGPAPGLVAPPARAPATHLVSGPNPVAPALTPPVAAQPQAQPQTQPQTQVQTQGQLQPVTAAAAQQQRNLQLALALNADGPPQDAPSTTAQMAMVRRPRTDEQAAFLTLSIALVVSSAFGLARLRAQPRDHSQPSRK